MASRPHTGALWLAREVYGCNTATYRFPVASERCMVVILPHTGALWLAREVYGCNTATYRFPVASERGVWL